MAALIAGGREVWITLLRLATISYLTVSMKNTLNQSAIVAQMLPWMVIEMPSAGKSISTSATATLGIILPFESYC